MTPKTLVEKLEDLRAGRSYGPFNSAKDAIGFLHTEAKRRKKGKATAS